MTKKPKPRIVGSNPKPKRGRPVKNKMPDPIPDSPENIMRAILEMPALKDDEWDYVKDKRRR